MKLVDRLRKSGENSKIIIKNTVGAFMVKGFSLIISFLTTPAFINYFHDNKVLGVWYTLLSCLIWFLNFDLGVGNGIRNQLVRDFASNDRKSTRETLSSGLFSVGLITVALSLIGILLLSTINLNRLFNISTEVLSSRTLYISTGLIFIGIMLRFLLTTINSIFYALQRSAINNFLGLCVSIIQLLFVLVFRFENNEEALIYLSAAFIVISNLPTIIAGIWALYKPLKDCKPSWHYITRDRMKQVVGIGMIFFLCQILYMLIVNTNEFLVTYFYGAEHTAEYTFYYKLTSVISMIVTLAVTPIWSVVTKAQAERDFIWLNKLYSKIKFFGILAIVLQFMLVPVLQTIMDLWLRENTIVVSVPTAISFACFGGCFVYSSLLSTIVCGLARMKTQAICYGLGIILKFVIIVVCAKTIPFKWDVVVWSNVAVLFPYMIVQQKELNTYFKKKAV